MTDIVFKSLDLPPRAEFVLHEPSLPQRRYARVNLFESDPILYRGVNTFLNEHLDDSGLLQWKKRIGEEKAQQIVEEAVTRGVALHEDIEHHLRRQKIVTLSPISRAVAKAIDDNVTAIYTETGSTQDKIETSLVSDRLRLIGAADLICDWRGEPAVVDFKTVKSLKRPVPAYKRNRYLLQAALYAMMIREESIVAPTKLVLIFASEDAPESRVLAYDFRDVAVNSLYPFYKYAKRRERDASLPPLKAEDLWKNS